ncbi:MAG: hypothetical protein WDN45_03510 [Caulobacteraceae bacterium]
MIIKVAPGETLEAAVRRTGIGKDEAQQAVSILGKTFDTVNIKAGMAFEANIAKPLGQQGQAKLMGLSLRTGPAVEVNLSRALDGALQVRKMEEQIVDQTMVASGKMEGSLYASAQKAGITPEMTAQVAKLFQHKLDFSRDIQAGDRFSMVFDRKVTPSGRTVSNGDLLFAEIEAKGGATRLYPLPGPRHDRGPVLRRAGQEHPRPAAAHPARHRAHHLVLRHARASDPGLHPHARGHRLRRPERARRSMPPATAWWKRPAGRAAMAAGCRSSTTTATRPATATCRAGRSSRASTCIRARWWPMSAPPACRPARTCTTRSWSAGRR